MGGLLVTLALNVVNGLPTYTNYALNLIHSLMRMSYQGFPKGALMRLRRVRLPSRRARLLSLRVYTNARTSQQSLQPQGVASSHMLGLELSSQYFGQYY